MKKFTATREVAGSSDGKTITRRRRRVVSGSENTAAGPGKNRRRSTRILTRCAFLLIAVLGSGLIIAAALRPARRAPATASVLKISFLPPPADHEKTQQQAKLALDCIGAFFSASDNVTRLAQLRPAPGLAKAFAENHQKILELAECEPFPGGKLMHQPPFIGIPLKFANHLPMTAWVELRGGSARLDLESLIGTGSVSWEKLATAEAGTRIFLRGILSPIEGMKSEMDFFSPDTKHRIRIHGPRPENLSAQRPACITVVRTPQTPLHKATWTIAGFHCWEWLMPKG